MMKLRNLRNWEGSKLLRRVLRRALAALPSRPKPPDFDLIAGKGTPPVLGLGLLSRWKQDGPTAARLTAAM